MRHSCAVLVILMTVSVCSADYLIDWYTIDGGGGTSSGGQYSLTGTIGQADAGYMAGGDYELLGGFWVGGPMCIVDFEQFSLFAQYWLESGADLPADIDGSGTVDLADFEMFAYEWLFYCPIGWPLR